jgi:hypothetical protein
LSAAVHYIEAFPVEVEVNSGWEDAIVVLIVSFSPIAGLGFLLPDKEPVSTSANSKDARFFVLVARSHNSFLKAG